ncbi:MAG: hypothetical protein QOD76_31, partial [Solirubrobacteraceae bacterium]|nr:hypothetical protein [Solirubrobacteraceae bacterium]
MRRALLPLAAVLAVGGGSAVAGAAPDRSDRPGADAAKRH